MNPDRLSLGDRVGLALERAGNKRLGSFAQVLYRLTRGRFVRLFTRRDVLLLTTRGRRSGRARSVLLQFFRDGENLVLVAANAGRPRHPAWYHNLKTTPIARVQIGARTFQVRAQELSAEAAAAYWPRILQVAPSYARYQRATRRTLPLVRLIPRKPEG